MPKGMDDKKPILEIKFNYRGDEAKAITTLKALVQRTKKCMARCPKSSTV